MESTKPESVLMKDKSATPQVQQKTIKVGEYELPGLALTPDGKVTHASMIDLFMVCLTLIAKGNTEVEEILKNNDISVKDVNGRMMFPRPQIPTKE